MKNKPVYKLMDDKGRVLIPKELRTASGMDYGDIVRLGLSNGTVSVQKVDIIEIGDQSPEAVEAYVRAALKTMPDDTRLSLISDLTALLQQKKEG
jgi:bifunctional DNA-binding transcriptional regulator/antitoxin component of YhaV-PrlF toxin-antitoxin module